MKIVLIAAILFLSGCVNLQTQSQMKEIYTWGIEHKAMAEKGDMKWSDYYQGMYDRIDQANGAGDKGFYLDITSQGIDASKSYEAGKISKDEFESYRRKEHAIIVQHDEDLRSRRAAQAAQAYSTYLQNQALLNQQWRARQPVYCNSNTFGNSTNVTCR